MTDEYQVIQSHCIIRKGNNFFRIEEIVDKLNEKEEQLKELNRINNICEDQINELRRLVNIATHNDFIKDSKKAAWKKELMRE